jgi:ribonuclease P protein component
VNRNFRLTQSTDFKRVRRFGKSYAHPLVVLVVLPSEGTRTRIGIAAGRSVGNAVQRNRAKRMLREAIRPLLPEVKSGWNVILLSRSPMAQASLTETRNALSQLLSKASLKSDVDGS